MDKIIGYNHTFSSTNIKPAFSNAEIVGGTIYYSYYFLLYPTGLAIVLAVPYELSSVSYNPATNYFTTSDSLSSGMVKLASITPKIYQFVGASQILVSAGAWSSTQSNTSGNAHYKGYYTTPNPISLDTSTKRIVWQGTRYTSLPEMLFIDPALWMGQTLSTDSIDTIRYPLYKKNNLYYKSTSTKEANAQYLSVASDAFSHSNTLSNLNQGGTKGYASRNKLGVLLNTETPNPQVPSSNSTFSQATTTNNTKDVYQIDDSRFMTEKFGIKDGNSGYQLSIAPSLSISGGYYLGKESESKANYPTTGHSRNNPGILFRNDTGYYEGVQITQNDIFFIDQFVLQIKDNQFKIPLNGTVRHYSRGSNDASQVVYNNGKILEGTTSKSGDYEEGSNHSSPIYGNKVRVTRIAGAGGLRNPIQPTPTFTFPTPSYYEKKLQRDDQQRDNQGTTLTPDGTIVHQADKEITLSANIKLQNNYQSIGTGTCTVIQGPSYSVASFSDGSVSFSVIYNLTIPLIPGIENELSDVDKSADNSYENISNSLNYWNKSGHEIDSGSIRDYCDTYNNKYLGVLELLCNFNCRPGILPHYNAVLVDNPTFQEMTVYTDRTHATTASHWPQMKMSSTYSTAGISLGVSTKTQDFIDIVVTYPE